MPEYTETPLADRLSKEDVLTELSPGPGTRLRSRVCTTEVVVIRTAPELRRLTCGGVPMLAADAESGRSATPAAGHAEGSELGKRYTNADGSVEVLVVKAGEGSLALDGVPLARKSAKPLPSSD
jgi:hypothetical protein